MCWFLFRDDPEGPISVPPRPVDPSSPRRQRRSIGGPSRVTSHGVIHTEERRPRSSAQSRRLSNQSTIPVQIVERSPRSSKASARSPRVVQERSPRLSGLSVPPPEPTVKIPPPDPPVQIPQPQPYPVFIHTPPASPQVPPPAPPAPALDHESSSESIITAASHRHRHRGDRRYRASHANSPSMEASTPPTPQSPPQRQSARDSLQPSAPSTPHRGSSQGSQSPVEGAQQNTTGEPKSTGSREAPQQRVDTRVTVSIGEYPSTSRDAQKMSGGAETSRKRSASASHQRVNSEGRRRPLYLDDPEKRRSAQLAEERIFHGEDGRKRKEYHYR
ncbi:MAG: hypothetical protein M1831_004815 [Alyxoria varia]|nr:MAG: hypothetical protein M1831_004815 [Alyxoria varia]